MFRSLFRKSPKNFLGIDIGTASIKIVELSQKGRTRQLENYGEFRNLTAGEKPFRPFKKDNFLLPNKEIAKAIKAVIQEAGIKTKAANFSIPDFCSFFTSFKLPSLTKEEIPEAVKYAARSYIPLPLSEITLDWVLNEKTNNSERQTPIEVLIAAIPNAIISQYQEIAFLTNLELKALEAEVFSLARSSLKTAAGKNIICLVDMGARSTTISIFENGNLKVSHSFNISGNEITEVFARALDIGYNKAEELKIKHGLNILESQEAGVNSHIKEILFPLVDIILAEMKKVFRDFYQREGKEVEAVVLAGSSALMPGLKEYFLEQLQKEIITANPFSDIVCPSLLGEILKEMGPSFSVAVGLALKGLG